MAITVDPNDFEAQLAFAQVYHKQGNLEMAANYYRKAVELNPAATDAALAVAEIGIKRNPTEAAEYAKKVLEQNPDSAMGHLYLGLALAAQDQIDAAVLEFDKAVELDANLTRAHYERGKVLLTKKKDAAGALPSLKAAVDLEPDNADYLTDYGAALVAAQQLDAALAALTKAANTPGYKDPVGLYNLGRVHFAKADYPSAVESLQKAAEASPPNWGAPYLALAWANFGMIKKGCPCAGDEAIVQAVQDNYQKAVEMGVSDPNLQTRIDAMAKGEKIK
jgi:Tfp pilus assembly protein PilF